MPSHRRRRPPSRRTTLAVGLIAALVLKAMRTRVTADCMAQQWRDDKRIKKKLGSCHAVPLAQRDFVDIIQTGRSIKIAGDTRPGIVADLFEAYVKSSRARKAVLKRD